METNEAFTDLLNLDEADCMLDLSEMDSATDHWDLGMLSTTLDMSPNSIINPPSTETKSLAPTLLRQPFSLSTVEPANPSFLDRAMTAPKLDFHLDDPPSPPLPALGNPFAISLGDSPPPAAPTSLHLLGRARSENDLGRFYPTEGRVRDKRNSGPAGPGTPTRYGPTRSNSSRNLDRRLFDLKSLPGIGKKTAARISEALNIYTVDELAKIDDAYSKITKIPGVSDFHKFVQIARAFIAPTDSLLAPPSSYTRTDSDPTLQSVVSIPSSFAHTLSSSSIEPPPEPPSPATPPSDTSSTHVVLSPSPERPVRSAAAEIGVTLADMSQRPYSNGNAQIFRHLVGQAVQQNLGANLAQALSPTTLPSTFSLRCIWEAMVELGAVPAQSALAIACQVIADKFPTLLTHTQSHILGERDLTGRGTMRSPPAQTRQRLAEFFLSARRAGAFQKNLLAGNVSDMQKNTGYEDYCRLQSGEKGWGCQSLAEIVQTFLTVFETPGALNTTNFKEPHVCGWRDFGTGDDKLPYMTPSIVGWFRVAWVAMRQLGHVTDQNPLGAPLSPAPPAPAGVAMGATVERRPMEQLAMWFMQVAGSAVQKTQTQLVVDVSAVLAEMVCEPYEWRRATALIAVASGYTASAPNPIWRYCGRWTPEPAPKRETEQVLARMVLNQINQASAAFESVRIGDAVPDAFDSSIENFLPPWP